MLALATMACDGALSDGATAAVRQDVEEPGPDSSQPLPIWHQPGPHSGPHILTCYGGCAAPHYDASACGGSTACCSNCIDGTWWYSTEQRNFGCGAKLEIRRDDRCVIVEVADNGPGDWVEDNAAARCGGSGWIIDASPLVADYFGGGCGYGECFWVNVRQVDSSLPQGPCASCPCDCTPSAETCNGQDDDCDGAVDEALVQGCGSDVGACSAGTQTCSGGAWSACVGAVDPQPETCDGEDDDCDGAVDEDAVCANEELVFQAGTVDFGETSDIDGDGRADACAREADGLTCQLASGHGFETTVVGPALSDAAGFADASYYGTLRTGDLDGDGRADVCIRTAAGVLCWRSTGTSFGRSIAGPALSDDAGWREPRYWSTLRLADVNGDGRADLCARASDGLRCWPSSGTAMGAPIGPLEALADAAGFDDPGRVGTLRLGDVDGDRRADVCARGAAGMLCWPATGDGFGPPITGPAWSDGAGWGVIDRWSTIRLVDVDGDGRADLCGRGAAGWECHLSTGDGFRAVPPIVELSDAAGFTERARYASIRAGDVDGDGDGDLCALTTSGLGCWLWTGAGFDRRRPGPAPLAQEDWSRPDQYRTLRLADVNGDGRADLCGRVADGLRCWLSDGAGFDRELLGPAWGDPQGWQGAAYYATIRVAGGKTGSGTAIASGCAVAVAPGNANPRATLALAAALLAAAVLTRARARARRHG